MGFFIIIFPRMEIPKKFANNAANEMNTECFVFKYLQHTLATGPFVQIFQNTSGF